MNTMKCRKCGSDHKLFYQLQVNGTKHLIYYCGRSIVYAPFVAGLNLEIHKSKKLLKTEEPTIL